MKGFRYFVVAFPEVNSLSAILSDERFFNGVCEQVLFINQPEVVRVDYEGVEFLLGKISGGLRVSIKSSFSQLGSLLLQPKPSRCSAVENCFGT